jgi:hypothetical protein
MWEVDTFLRIFTAGKKNPPGERQLLRPKLFESPLIEKILEYFKISLKELNKIVWLHVF